MTPRDFCYWLQGYFELDEIINGHAPPLSVGQTRAVYNHLNLVLECNPRLDMKDQCNGFMYVLKGFLDGHLKHSEDYYLADEELDYVRDTLAKIFEHVIDPTHGTPEQQATLQNIHDGVSHLDPAKNPGGLMRC